MKTPTLFLARVRSFVLAAVLVSPLAALAQSDATLALLIPSDGTLVPDFASTTYNYTTTVPYATATFTVTPYASDFAATVTVNGSPVGYGTPSAPISLSVGANPVTTVVVSQNTTVTNTYTITVTRQPPPSSNADLASLVPSVGTLTPAFNSNTLSYTAIVLYPTATMTVTPTAADATATITVNGNPVVSGSPSGPIALSIGANNISTVVTAEDTVTTKTYTLAVTVSVTNPVALPGGPYFVFAGGTLALNGTASLPSDGQTIAEPTGYEWDLNPADNGGVFNADVTGATPAAISEATLRGTYGMSLGGNTIKLRVTDSATKTSVATATVNILPAVALVYEPFNYSGTALNGVSGTTEVGLTNTWNASVDSKLGPNRAFGALVTRGAGIGDLGGGQNRYGGARPISPSALKDKGLLNDGATLWFSLIMGYDTGGNVSNSRLAFSLANNQFSTANFTYNILNEGTTNGVGLGVTLGGFSGNGKVVATLFSNSGTGNPPGFSGNTFGTTNGVLYGAGQSGLIVGKITWGVGAANDTIEIYNPGVDLVLPSTPISTLSVAVDQSTFDTITWARGDKVVMDEIRFGGSYQAVIETGSAWDLNGNVAGAGGATPSGTWNTTNANWNLAPDGTLVPIPWQAGGVAIFSAGNDATGAYTATVSGTQDIGGLLFEDGTVTISGGTALRLTKDTTMSVAPGLTASIATPLTEDGSGRQFAKAGAGTLILSGNNVGATNGMNLSAGVTRFESPASINGTARNITIGSGGTLMFGPAFGAGNIPAALSNRVADSSSGVIAADNCASLNIDFNTASLTNARLGAVGNVNYTGTLTPFGTTYRLGGGGGTLTMANANALTGPNALVVSGNVTLAQTNDYTGTTTINAGSTVTILGPSSSSAVSLNTPNTLLVLGHNASLGTGTLAVNNSFAGPGTLAAIGTVVTTNPITAYTDFTFGGTGALTLGTVTLSNNVTITSSNTTSPSIIGAITAGGGVRTLAFSGNGETTVAGGIGGGSGITTLTKNGTGTLILSSANTYTGTTTPAGGVLRLNDALAIPGGIGSSATSSNVIFNGGVIGLGVDNYYRPLNAANTLGATTFTGNGGWAAYGADRLVNLGGASASIIWATNGTGLNARTVILGATTATHKVTLQNPLDLGNAVRTVQVDNGAAAVDGELTGALSGAGGGLTKTGAGTLALTAANTYTGPTLVSAGRLLVNGDSSAVTNTVTVQTNATLGGTGTLGGTVTVNDGGNLAPGASVGTLTVSNLNVSALAAGTTGKLVYELGPTNSSDKLVVTGTLTIGTNVLGFGDFVFTNVGGLQAGTYKLITSAALNGGDALDTASTNGTLGSFNASLQLNGNDLELVVSSASVPPLPTLLTNSVSGNSLSLSWPAGQGWRLQQQTNGLNVGLSTNWVEAAGSSVSSTNITVDPAKPTTFYRLVYP